jgi:hypothetical protein
MLANNGAASLRTAFFTKLHCKNEHFTQMWLLLALCMPPCLQIWHQPYERHAAGAPLANFYQQRWRIT